jgi:metal-responsive CopG/Arc/MetJ family transcriptional regulator
MSYLSITVPLELKRALDREAKREKMGRSTLIQKAVRVYLELKKRNERNALLRESYDELNDIAKELLTDFSQLDGESFKNVS